MGPGIRIESVATTHVGRIRPANEDSVCARDDLGLWAVADGMGGHEHGEWASAAIVAALDALGPAARFDAGCAAVGDAIRRANRAIWTEGRNRRQSMGSTVVALRVVDDRYGLLWVGDSRAYRLRAGSLEQVSRDHSQVQQMVDAGLLSREEARSHPMGHILTRAVGVDAEVEVAELTGALAPGDIFLLCSDGLTGEVRDDEIAVALSAPVPLAEMRDSLLALTLDRGAPDNVTIVIVAAL